MSGATGNPQWHEGQIAQNPSNTARRNPKPDKHHVESRDNLVEISEESLYASRKTTWKLRRIELRNGACYLVRPSFLMPYLTGRTEDVQGPLFFASSPSLSGL